jgi:hypothetical protein
MAIRPKAVLQTLDRCHGGVLRAAGTDAAAKLLRSMRMREGLVGELRERLHEMADANEVVIECEGNRFDLIATPEALENTANDTKDGEDSMIAPAGQRRTTSPRDGQGRELPSRLRNKDVGPVLTTYKNEEVGEAIATAAELVREELVKSGKQRHGRDELLATIQGILLPLYDGKAEVAQTLAMPVLSFLVDNGHAKRVSVPRGRHDEIVIEILLPEPPAAEEPKAAVRQEFDPVEMLALLAPELEAARLRITELETLAENAVSPDTVARITERAEELQSENEDLRRKLEEAADEKEKILAAQKERLTKARTDHTASLAKLRKEGERTVASVRKELETALSANASLEAAAQKRALPPELQRRVEKLLNN